jgi:anti-sigma regulatory factor (Ser/Thr protein kinase)
MYGSVAQLVAIKNNQTINIAITDESYIGAARRQAVAMANTLDFSKAEIEKIAIIINELGTNLIKHASANKTRQLLIKVTQAEDKKSFTILALDKGPGIRSVAQSLQDGYSTANTAGTGLGAISRLANFYNIYSLPEHGTIVLAQVHSKNNATSHSVLLSPFEVDGISLPIRGEEISGDSWSYYQSNHQLLVIVADGLGHGPDAAQASQLACEIFHKNTHLPPAQIIFMINTGLTRTRGAAVAIAAIDKKQQQVKYAGLGNISGCIYSDKKTQQLVSHDGTAGMGPVNIQEYTYRWSDKAILIMHSDGIISRWTLDPYIGLSGRHPAMIAGALYRDFNRGSDDTTVVVVKG